MKIRIVIGLFLSLAVSAMFGCGGGGGGEAPPASTIVSGMASKGPIKTGTVKVYAIRDGVEDRSVPLGQGVTDNSGNYSIDVGSYKGSVLVEVSSGSFVDEVTDLSVNLKAPLRAVYSNVSTGSKKVAVTPLTELAYKKVKGGGTITPAAIDEANASIATAFSLTDIVSTLPVAGAGDDAQKKYAAVCGSFSQLVNDNRNTGESLDDALERVMTEIGTEMEDAGGLSLGAITRINDAMTKFSNSGKNPAGVPLNPLDAPIGGLLKISTSGTPGTIGAIDVTINLPAGLTVKADANTGEVASGVVMVSGVAAVGANSLSVARMTAGSGGTPAQLHIGLINATGFDLGEFLTIRFDVTGGSFPASPTAFSLASFSARDLEGSPLGGITAAPASVGAEIR